MRYGIVLSTLFVFALLLGAQQVEAQKSKPAWLLQRPPSKDYYIGIGYASKQDHPTDYQEVARNNALNDIAGQIKVRISGTAIQQVLEKGGILSDQFKSYVRASTKAELEAYEQVDIWEDAQDYWVYYRLSKARYARLHKAKREKAKALSLDMLRRARLNETQNDPGKALLFYLQAILPIEKYLNEPLEAEINGQKVYLFNEIYASLQRLLSEIKLTALNGALQGKMGQALKKPLRVQITYEHGARHLPVANMPVVFSFYRGSGELVRNARSNEQGIALGRVLRINSSDNLQIVRSQIDLQKLINQETTSLILKGVLNSLVAPEARFMIRVGALSAFVESKETVLGEPVRVKQLEPALKNGLSANGFVFVNNPAKADYKILIVARVRQGAELYGLYSAFATVTLSVTRVKSGVEIYKNVLEDVKGIDLNYRKAGFKALRNAAKKIDQAWLSDLLQKMGAAPKPDGE